MDRLDRRTFLTGGLKIGATLGVAGAVAGPKSPAAASTGDGPTVTSVPPGPPARLTAGGAGSPVGIDPDTVQFAWHVNDDRRGAIQTGYRIVVSGPEPDPGTVWDSGRVISGRQAFVAYGGPALSGDSRYHWTVTTADRGGRWSQAGPEASFITGLRTGDWTAQWLRPGPADPGQEEYSYLRTTRMLPGGTVAYATAYVAGAHKYQLWMNGSRLDTGPSFCFPDEQYYQATDVTAAVLGGRPNALGVLHHWYGPGRGRPTSAPGVLVQLVVHYHDGRVVTVASDDTWTTRPAEWLPAPQRTTDSGDFVEWIDGRLSPIGWSDADFDDRAWPPVATLGPVGTEPFTNLFAQRTRITEHEVAPVSVGVLPTGSVVVDFGKVYAGRPVVSFRQGTDGQTVPMHVGYTLDPDGSVSTTHSTQITDLSFLYIQRAGAQTFDPYWYLGFRYLQIDDPGEEISSDQVMLAARHATMPDQPAAAFSSSNRMLDEVWALCAHSGLYTSQEQFIDTPTREKGQFLWDAANESQTVMRAYGDQNLSWQGIRDMARAQRRYWASSGQVNEIYPNDDGAQDYPTFTALYPEWVWRYYLSTGDLATVVGLLPTLELLSDFLAGTIDGSTGLVSGQPLSTNGDNDYGYDYNTNADTTLNILAVNSFRRVADVAQLAGDDAAAWAQAERMSALTSAVNALLVTVEGLYVDGLRADGTQSAHSSQLANLAALAYGVAPASQVAAVAEHVASLDISVEPDHGMELLRALHAAGRDSDVVRILTDPSFPGWAAIIEFGGTFTWETWTPSDLIGDSMSHGWGSSALVAMQEVLLGATPTAPSADGPPTVVTFTRPEGGLTRASGTFPTPAGTYAVGWQTAGGKTTLTLTVPPNAAAHCVLPGVSTAQITEGGGPVERAPGVSIDQGPPEALTVLVGAGRYDFTVAD
jgi:alpha-L-rhamnosidase